MGNFMKHACGVMKKYATKVAFLDDKRTMTHRELDRESGQIYAWLKERGIGKEDFVQIVLPRGPECLAAALGVLKAGAAFQMMEDTDPASRIEFIRQDVGAKAVLDESLYRHIAKHARPLEGYEETDSHDAAFAVYTSGSTGNPKGILHEYGNLELIARYLEVKSSYRDEPMALALPLSFVAAVFYFVNSFNALCPMYIVDPEVYRDMKAFSALLREKKVFHLNFPPSYIRQYQSQNYDTQSLEWITVGSEPTNGIYYAGGKPAILSHYTMSEAGFPVLNMFLDKAYEHAVLGKPVIEEIDVHLEAEDGTRVEGAGEGEVCFKNEYVRGYIHLPDKTRAAFRNGYYYTGDLARSDGSGIYFLVGRKDDMFKINGNRVEPGEIEAAFRKITGLKTVVAKGFDIEGRSFICLYYLRGEAAARNILRGNALAIDLSPLSDMLPHYMLPTYYVPLEEMPVNERGKMVRRLLVPPDPGEFSGEYVPPANEDEEAICKMMAEILGKENIGAQSDFYLLGGDSLRTIRLIALAGERGYSFTARDLYEARTPRKLAKIMGRAGQSESLAVSKAGDLAILHKNFAEDGEKFLSTGEMDSYTGSFFTRNKAEVMSPAAGIHFRFTLAEEVDEERLNEAIREAVRECPYAAYGLRFNETMPRLTFQRMDDRLPLFRDDLPQSFADEALSGHFGFVSFAGKELTICLCHAITDGYGFFRFAHALFAAYCDYSPLERSDLAPVICSGSRKRAIVHAPSQAREAPQPCWAADMMKYLWPVPEGIESLAGKAVDMFRLSGTKKSTDGLHRHFFIDRQSFDAFCHKIGRSHQGAAAYLLARAMQMAHPENDKIIRVRCPIDTRAILGVPHTFQNASVPHMYLEFSPKNLLPQLTAEEAHRISGEVYRQLSYEYAAHTTNVLAEAAKAEDKADFDRIILAYVRQSELCVSYIDAQAGKAMPKAVLDMAPAYESAPPFPVMLYFWEMGEKISVQYAQDFDDASCWEMLCRTLKELEIKVM